MGHGVVVEEEKGGIRRKGVGGGKWEGGTEMGKGKMGGGEGRWWDDGELVAGAVVRTM